MKSLIIAFILLFPSVALAGPVCNASALIVQGIARDRDQGVPLQQELFNVNVALANMGMLSEENLKGMEIVVRSVYQSSKSPSSLMNTFLSTCQEP